MNKSIFNFFLKNTNPLAGMARGMLLCFWVCVGGLVAAPAIAQVEIIRPLQGNRPENPSPGFDSILRSLDIKSVGSVDVLTSTGWVGYLIYGPDGFDINAFIENVNDGNVPFDGGVDPILVSGESVLAVNSSNYSNLVFSNSNSSRLIQILGTTTSAALNRVRIQDGLESERLEYAGRPIGEYPNGIQNSSQLFFGELDGTLFIPGVNQDAIDDRLGVFDSAGEIVPVNLVENFFAINPLVLQIVESYNSFLLLQTNQQIGEFADQWFINGNLLPTLINAKADPVSLTFIAIISTINNLKQDPNKVAFDQAINSLRNLFVAINAIDYSIHFGHFVEFSIDDTSDAGTATIFSIDNLDGLDIPIIKDNDLSFDTGTDGVFVACNGCGGFAFEVPMEIESLPNDNHRWDGLLTLSPGESMTMYGHEFRFNGGDISTQYSIFNASGDFLQHANVVSLLLALPDFENDLLAQFGNLPDSYDLDFTDKVVLSNTLDRLSGGNNNIGLLQSSDLSTRTVPWSDAGLMLDGFSTSNILPAMTSLSVDIASGLNFGFLGSGTPVFGDPVPLPFTVNQNLNRATSIVTEAMLPGKPRHSALIPAFSESLADPFLAHDLFEQALTLKNDQVALSPGSNRESPKADYVFKQSDLYPFIKDASMLAAEQAERTLALGVFQKDFNIMNAWVDKLEKGDEKLFYQILQKTERFKRVNRLEADQRVTLLPRVSLDLQITPVSKVRNQKLDMSLIDYEVDLLLQNVVIQLGTDDNCDGVAELAVELTPEEQDFINDMWARDVDGDGIAEEGFVIWLQDRMDQVEERLKISLAYGETEIYGKANSVLGIQAIAEWTKAELDLGRLDLSSELDARINSGNLSRWNLESDREYPEFKTGPVEQPVIRLDSTGFGPLDLSPPALEIRTSWNPLDFVYEEPKQTIIDAPESISNLELESFAFNPLGIGENVTTNIAVGSPYRMEGLLVNNGSSLNNLVVHFEVTTSKEMAWYHLKRLEIPSLGEGEMAPLYFSYVPLTTGSHSLRVKVNGTVVFSHNYNVGNTDENVLFCAPSASFTGTVGSGASQTFTGGYVLGEGTVNSNGNLTLEASNTIVLRPGFRANKGSRFNTRIKSCEEVRNSLD